MGGNGTMIVLCRMPIPVFWFSENYPGAADERSAPTKWGRFPRPETHASFSLGPGPPSSGFGSCYFSCFRGATCLYAAGTSAGRRVGGPRRHLQTSAPFPLLARRSSAYYWTRIAGFLVSGIRSIGTAINLIATLILQCPYGGPRELTLGRMPLLACGCYLSKRGAAYGAVA